VEFSFLIGWCKLDEFILFFPPRSKKEKGKPNPHCSTFASPHEPTLKPMACKRAAILQAHHLAN
jgi:hypothetical protein